jgi:hypothetical protein
MPRGGKKKWNDNHYGYPFKQADGGRSVATKKYWGDCGPIALAIATGLPYDQCTAALAEDCAMDPSGGSWLDHFVHALGWQEKDFYGFKFEWRSFSAVKGQVRMRPKEFCRQFPTGNFILSVSRHYVACVDGVLMGEYPVAPDRCIYGAWRVYKANMTQFLDYDSMCKTMNADRKV